MLISTAGKSNDTGFTLLELVIVLSIFLIALSLVFPAISRMTSHHAESDAKMAASVLTFLNENAVMRRCNIPLLVDLEEKTLSWKFGDSEEKKTVKSLHQVYSPQFGVISQGRINLMAAPSGLSEGFEIRLKQEKEVWKVYLEDDRVSVKKEL